MSVTLHEDSQERLDDIRKKEEEDLVIILAKKYGLNTANLCQVNISNEALRLIPEKTARDAEVVAFLKQGTQIGFALRTPNSPKAQAVLRLLKERGYKTTVYMVSQASLEFAWKQYKEISLAVETTAGVLTVSESEVAKLKAELTSLEKIREAIANSKEMQHQYRITRILEVLIAGAMSIKASDIHIEPRESETVVRFRLDGVLVDTATFDLDTYSSALTRLKLISGLKINLKNTPQDGRFSLKLDDREIELRVSILPGGSGETVVMRLLDPASIGVSLLDLGIHPALLQKLLEEIHKPNGMILNTGPTGSGKTTTLYAFLKQVLNPDIKILTIEDPIEYHVEGIVQTQVDHKEYTFAGGLRSALRQDPDIIMVGEIRDHEVAETAVHAALTGHLVFSTLHTNNAAGAYPRLIDIGIQPTMIGSAVNVVMAQRLLRKLIPDKKTEVPLTGKDKEFVDRILDGIADKSLIPEKTDIMFVPQENTGELLYKGRIGAYEAIFTNKSIEDAIRSNMTIRELEHTAKEHQNFMTMHEDAILKVLAGTTTLSEVRRVLGELREE
jgi:type IV pilus assembly protein PilB